MENSAKINSGTLPVFFTPKAVRKAIAKLWKTVLSGQTIVQKASSLSNKIGQTIFDHLFTLFEDPNLEPYDCPLDDEGMPTMLKTFIEADTVKSFYWEKKMCCSCRMQVHWQ
ncbi:metallopeptidase TldD-related protein [Dapis sp. BLCC M229]|uniref:metallopeptidase TldD-related protein n=1 Tax=Dapis sp. BLCC M229 TaxID=3400188 RepID=UPI003CEA4BC5